MHVNGIESIHHITVADLIEETAPGPAGSCPDKPHRSFTAHSKRLLPTSTPQHRHRSIDTAASTIWFPDGGDQLLEMIATRTDNMKRGRPPAPGTTAGVT